MIYQLLIRLLAPLIVALIVVDSYKRRGGWRFIQQRLGFGYPTANSQNPIWLHCASVGEVKAVEQLIKTSYQANNQAWLLTTSTPTGMQIARKLNLPADLYYLPFDWPFAVKNFIQATKPTQLLVVETEIWPNLYQIAAEYQLPITLINGRISDKTLQAPNWLKRQYQACLQQVQLILAKSAADQQKFIQLGAEPEKVQVAGNLKLTNLEVKQDFSRLLAGEYLLLASSHPDEELAIAQLWLTANQQLQTDLKLVIVPRHATRAPKILQQLQAAKIPAEIYQTPNQTTEVLLVDKFGVLANWIAHAKLVIMGGSFVAKGGHNFLEAAAMQKAIITGADNRDFAEELELLQQQNGILIAQNYQQLTKYLLELLANQDKLELLANNSLQALRNHKKVLNRYLKFLGLNQVKDC